MANNVSQKQAMSKNKQDSEVNEKMPVYILEDDDYQQYITICGENHYRVAKHRFRGHRYYRYITGIVPNDNKSSFIVSSSDFFSVLDILGVEQNFQTFLSKLRVLRGIGKNIAKIKPINNSGEFKRRIEYERSRRNELRRTRMRQFERLTSYLKIYLLRHDNFLILNKYYVYFNINEDLLIEIKRKLYTNDGKEIDVELCYSVLNNSLMIDADAFQKLNLSFQQKNEIVCGMVEIINHASKKSLALRKSETYDKQNAPYDLCVLPSDEIKKAIKDIRKLPQKKIYEDCVILKNDADENIILGGIYLSSHKMLLINVADLVKNNISIEKNTGKFYVGTFSKELKSEHRKTIWDCFVIRESLDEVKSIISFEYKRIQPFTDKNEICVVSSEDYLFISACHNIRWKVNRQICNFRRKDGGVFEINGIYSENYHCVFVNVKDILGQDIVLQDHIHNFSVGAIPSGVNFPKAIIQSIQIQPGEEKLSAFLKQTETKYHEKNTESNNKPKQNQSSSTVMEAPEHIWHSEVNLSEMPANKKIMLYSEKCHCTKCAKKFGHDTIMDCTAYVTTKKGNVVPVTAQYCRGCATFFMNYEVFESYNNRYGGLRFTCKIDRSSIGKGYDIGFANDSFLSRAGYSVRSGVSKRERQMILANLIDSHRATKWQITEKLSEFIKLRKGNRNMEHAVKCWEEDIAFVSDYGSNLQTNVGMASFGQGGKITRR